MQRLTQISSPAAIHSYFVLYFISEYLHMTFLCKRSSCEARLYACVHLKFILFLSFFLLVFCVLWFVYADQRWANNSTQQTRVGCAKKRSQPARRRDNMWIIYESSVLALWHSFSVWNQYCGQTMDVFLNLTRLNNIIVNVKPFFVVFIRQINHILPVTVQQWFSARPETNADDFAQCTVNALFNLNKLYF